MTKQDQKLLTEIDAEARRQQSLVREAVEDLRAGVLRLMVETMKRVDSAFEEAPPPPGRRGLGEDDGK